MGLPTLITCNILCVFKPTSCSTPLHHNLEKAPLKHLMCPVGVRNLVITSFISLHSFFLRVQGALGNLTWPFRRSIGQALCILPEHYRSIQIPRESRMPIKWSQTFVATFLKMCMGSNKWFTFNSAQHGSSKNIDNLSKLK
jgi:hypothetical protein